MMRRDDKIRALGNGKAAGASAAGGRRGAVRRPSVPPLLCEGGRDGPRGAWTRCDMPPRGRSLTSTCGRKCRCRQRQTVAGGEQPAAPGACPPRPEVDRRVMEERAQATRACLHKRAYAAASDRCHVSKSATWSSLSAFQTPVALQSLCVVCCLSVCQPMGRHFGTWLDHSNVMNDLN